MKKKTIFSLLFSLALTIGMSSTLLATEERSSVSYTKLNYYGLTDDGLNEQVDFGFKEEYVNKLDLYEIKIKNENNEVVINYSATKEQIAAQINDGLLNLADGMYTGSIVVADDVVDYSDSYWTIQVDEEKYVAYEEPYELAIYEWKDDNSQSSTGYDYGWCIHADKTTMFNVEPTCLTSGHFIYYVCNKKHCKARLNSKDAISPMTDEFFEKYIAKAALGHDNETSGAVEATCEHDGYTGDVKCKRCGNEVIGSVIPITDHKEILVGEIEPTCEEDGYTGDIWCEYCDTLLEEGIVLSKYDHNIELTNAKEATCEHDGYTGDEQCIHCDVIFKKGEAIAKLEHEVKVVNVKEATYENEGYTGDKICAKCNTVIEKGKTIDKLIKPANKDKNDAPVTGDHTNIALYSFMLFISGLAVLASSKRIRKNRA